MELEKDIINLLLQGSNAPLCFAFVKEGVSIKIKHKRVSCPEYGLTHYKVGFFYKMISEDDI